MKRTGYALMAAVCASAASPGATAQLVPNHTLEYARVGGSPLHLDLYLPDGSAGEPRPVVVWVHGGGWSSGRRWPIPPVCEQLVADGFVVASISYRLTSHTGQWGQELVTFPAQIHDVKGAIRFLRSRAEQYALDPERFGVFGASAGGHLAALAATSGGVSELEGTTGGNAEYSSTVQAAATYFGPTVLLQLMPDVTTPPGTVENHDAPTSNASRLIGYSEPGQGIGDIRANENNPDPPYPALLALLAQTNPLTYVSPDDPPFFIAHGDMDARIPVNQSRRLADALAAAGVPHEYLEVPGATHNMDELGAAADAGVLAFFLDALSEPDCAPTISQDPQGATVMAGTKATFTVVADGSDLTYQWRRDGVDLADGGSISGATTDTLVIAGALPADAGDYDVVVENPCGQMASAPATLTVTVCPVDITMDGVLTLEDFVAFRNAYVAGDMAADFDGSGDLTLGDFVAFRNAYVAGCP